MTSRITASIYQKIIGSYQPVSPLNLALISTTLTNISSHPTATIELGSRTT
ncbi:MAG: hypothetical protein IPK46_09885 [Saprospiraceae bacterium]|nr:hypothetical protein [Saprospiraceae bacterium]